MSLPVYLQGPPLASQIWSTSLALKESTSVVAKKQFTRRSTATRAVKSSTMAVIAGLLPRRSYKDFSLLAICSPVVAQPVKPTKLNMPNASQRCQRICCPPVVVGWLGIDLSTGAPQRVCRTSVLYVVLGNPEELQCYGAAVFHPLLPPEHTQHAVAPPAKLGAAHG